MEKKFDWKKYIITFSITLAIFLTALYTSSYFNQKRIQDIRATEEKISVDILSLETQFDLLQELSCKDIKENPVLSQELNSLAKRLAFAEEQLGTDNDEVLALKRSYTILQIKDYILMKRVSEKCKDFNPVFVFYFYSNSGDCPDCNREGYVLTFLREQYPQLRVYAFDYNLDLSALRTLVNLNNVEKNLPALVISDTVYYGFQSREDIELAIPDLEDLRETATSTVKTD
jgi:hypothetical protein